MRYIVEKVRYPKEKYSPISKVVVSVCTNLKEPRLSIHVAKKYKVCLDKYTGKHFRYFFHFYGAQLFSANQQFVSVQIIEVKLKLNLNLNYTQQC